MRKLSTSRTHQSETYCGYERLPLVMLAGSRVEQKRGREVVSESVIGVGGERWGKRESAPLPPYMGTQRAFDGRRNITRDSQRSVRGGVKARKVTHAHRYARTRTSHDRVTRFTLASPTLRVDAGTPLRGSHELQIRRSLYCAERKDLRFAPTIGACKCIDFQQGAFSSDL